MFGLLLLLFLIVPIAELWVILEVSDYLGAGTTIVLLILISVVGAWLVKREGLGIWRSINRQVRDGEMPTRSLVDGGLVLFAGALMLTPGFLTDGLGLLLLFPPTRALMRGALMRRFRNRYESYSAAGQVPGFAYRTVRTRFGERDSSRRAESRRGADDVIDVDSYEIDSDEMDSDLGIAPGDPGGPSHLNGPAHPDEIVDFDGNTGH